MNVRAWWRGLFVHPGHHPVEGKHGPTSMLVCVSCHTPWPCVHASADVNLNPDQPQDREHNQDDQQGPHQ